MKAIPLVLSLAFVTALVGCNRETSVGPESAKTSAPFPGLSAIRGGQTVDRGLRHLPSVDPASNAVTKVGNVHLRRIGTPTWRPVDFHLFTAPIGTASSGYAEFLTTVLALLPAPNHQLHPQLGVGPGAPHNPPYDNELAAGVAAQGFPQKHAFAVSEFSQGKGIFLAWMNIPDPGTTGSSPDFGSGTIISNDLFPIAVSGTSSHKGSIFDAALVGFSVPKLDQDLDPPFNVDGHSHFPVIIADNADFGPAGANLHGAYSYDITMMDQDGNGWSIQARFAAGPP